MPRLFRSPIVIAAAILAAIVSGVTVYRYVDRHLTHARQYADLEEQRAAQKGAPAPPPSAIPDYWTDFRGPARDGHYRERAIRTDWAGLRRTWRQPIGGGYASFSIGG